LSGYLNEAETIKIEYCLIRCFNILSDNFKPKPRLTVWFPY